MIFLKVCVNDKKRNQINKNQMLFRSKLFTLFWFLIKHGEQPMFDQNASILYQNFFSGKTICYERETMHLRVLIVIHLILTLKTIKRGNLFFGCTKNLVILLI